MISTVCNIHLKTVVAMLGAPACEVGAVDHISASDIELVGALITKRNLSCISVRPCHRPHGCGLGEGEVPLGELGVEQDRPVILLHATLVASLQALGSTVLGFSALHFSGRPRQRGSEPGPGLR